MEQRETMVMEQRLLLPYAYPCYPNPSEVEMEVAEILMQLPDIISEFESPLPIPLCLTWGCKRRRRSAAAVKNHYASALHTLLRLGLPPCWCNLLLRCRIAAKPLPLPPANAVKVESSSPDTPLSLEPSESDDNLRTKVLGKRRRENREEWSQIVEELTEKKESLQMELEKVELHYANLNAFNLELKSRKEELMRVGHNQEGESRLEVDRSLNEPVMPSCRPAQPAVVSPPPPGANQVHYQHHQQIQIPAASSVMLYQNQLQHVMMNQTAQTQRREMCENLSSSSSSIGRGLMRMVNWNNNANHNVPFNPYRPYDLSWRDKKHLVQVLPIDPAAAKRNRLERLEKCRGKKSRCHAAR